MKKPYFSRNRTRTEIARAMLERLRTGPDFRSHPDGTLYTPEQAICQYHAWAESWLLDEARYLLHNDMKEPSCPTLPLTLSK